MKNKKKLIIITLAAFLAVAAVTAASVYFVRNKSSNVVEVYPMELLNSAGMYNEESELSGTISSDFVQEVYPSGSEDVSKVFVKQGDSVKEGDNLLQYDVEEQELDLQLQKLHIKASKMEIERMEKELQKMKGTRTRGAADSSGSNLMNASMNLSSIKDSVMSALLGNEEGQVLQNEAEEDTTAGQKPKLPKKEGAEAEASTEKTVQNIGAASVTELSQAVSGDGSSEDSKYVFQLQQSGEEGAAAPVVKGSVLNALSKNTTKNDAKYAAFQLYTGTDLIDTITLTPELYISGTVEDGGTYTFDTLKGKISNRKYTDTVMGYSSYKTDYSLYEKGTVKGSVLKSIVSGAQTVTFLYYASEDAEAGESVTVRPVYVAAAIDENKEYRYKDIKELADSTYRQKVLDVRFDCAYGDGTEDSSYVFDMCENGIIKGSVIHEIVNGDSSAIFRTFKTKSDYDGKRTMEPTAKIVTSTPALLAVQADKFYTVSQLKNIINDALASIELIEKIEKKEDAASGTGESKSPYIYKLLENGQIKGSVLNEILNNKSYAVFGEYKLNKDGSTGELVAAIDLRPNTIFKENISSMGWYTIVDLNKLLVMADKIEIRPSRKTVTAGKTYKFNAKVSGRNPESLSIIWELKNNKSDSTTLNNGELVVDSSETADNLRIIARAGEKKAVLVVKVKGGSSGRKGGGGSDDYTGGGSYGGSGGGYIDNGGEEDYSDYTADELKEAISDKESELAEAKQDLKEARINYKEAKKEVDAATVKSKVNGEVTLAYTKEAMPTDGSPAIIVRSDDGMYVDVNISEMALDTVKVGGTITCMSWENGEEYEAVVKEVSEYPTSNTSNYDMMGNPNNSYYPVVAYIEDAEGLNTGDNVSVTYDSQSMGTEDEDMICIQKAYVRSENKKSYVYKEGKDGRLKKQYVKTGSTIYGQYVEVLAGLSLDDNLAFPYGKNVKEGAKVKLSENEENIIY